MIEPPSVIKVCQRAIASQMKRGMVNAERAYAELANDHIPGSGRAGIEAWLVEQEKSGNEKQVRALAIIASDMVDDVFKIGASLADHLRALDRLIVIDAPLQSSVVTIARSIIEATLQIAWLLDPKAEPRTHVLRSMALRLDAIEGSERTAKLFPSGTADVSRQEEAVDGVHEWLEAAGFTRLAAKNDRYSVNIGLQGEHVNLKFNATEAALAYLPSTAEVWAVFSGAAHSKGWYNASAYRFADEDTEIASYDDTHAAAVLGVLDASDAFIEAVFGYVGLDPTSEHKSTHLFRRAILGAAGTDYSPMDWEEFRNARFLQRSSEKSAATFGVQPHVSPRQAARAAQRAREGS